MIHDLGWTPVSPLRWVTSGGRVLDLLRAQRQAWRPLHKEVQREVLARGWARQANSFCGQGLEEGADLTAQVKLLKHLRSEGKHALASAATKVLEWGQLAADASQPPRAAGGAAVPPLPGA